MQNEFKNKTGYRIGDFKIDAKGSPYIEPTALRIPDINNPVNTVLRQTLKGLATYKTPGEKPIKITNVFDKTMMRVKTVEERLKALKKWQGKPELLNSRYIKALGAIPRLKSFVKLLTAGTITSAALTTLAQAEELEPSDKKQEAGISATDVGKGALATAAGYAVTHPGKVWEGAKKVGSGVEKAIRPLFVPAVDLAIHHDPKDVTSPAFWMTKAFWAGAMDKYGITRTYSMLKNSPNFPEKARIARDIFLRAGINPAAVRFISSKVAWPATAAASVYDSYKDYQKRKPDIEKQKELIEQGVIKEEEFDKEEPMFAMGGIASLIK